MSSRADTPARCTPLHLYVHVPVCRSKCSYCDFFSMAAGSLPLETEQLAQLLLDQALGWLERGLEGRPLASLYVGGGTPSILGPALPALVERICAAYGCEPGAEVTVEANPDSLDRELAADLRLAGVTRLSLGVQSFNDAELRLLGRVHDASQARAAARHACEAGLALSLDVMCGVPGQDAATWRATLEAALAAGAGHLSVYPLALEAGTPLAAAVLLGDVPEPDADAAADAMIAASELLGAAGLTRYEVANHARPGHESRHNTAYWTGAEYLGVGPSAHGMLDAATARAAGFVGVSESTARVRYAVASDLGEGLARTPRVDVEMLGLAEAAREDAMLGMRLAAGITDELATGSGTGDALLSLERDGLVVHEASRWRVTPRGWLLGNEVFARIWNADVV